MVLDRVGIGGRKPVAVVAAFRFLGVVHGHDHRGQEGRLRARQHIASVGVQKRAVVGDLEKEVLHHAARQVDAARLHESADDEVAVPPVHLVEHPARNNVGMRKIKESVRVEALRVDLSQPMDHLGQARNLRVAFTGDRLELGGRGEIRRQVDDRGRRRFRVRNALATGHRARKRIPSARNVALDFGQACLLVAEGLVLSLSRSLSSGAGSGR